ncbi:hypothetical protein N8T08_002527 [Aspergillus melleus]|uniref:Uncharacterized protein n=1 Tax=Aspergillus melleus TaxID=138277 RepID=A0ACC3B8D4_9EURO|nr:hypothetical protein N8T08_002527 [Aspergillus melleus]
MTTHPSGDAKAQDVGQKVPKLVDRVADEKSPSKEQSRGDAPSVAVGELDSSGDAEEFLRIHNLRQSDLEELLQDEQAQKRLVRRVDWLLMPLLCGTYLLQYIDKQALSYGAVFDLFDNTGISSDEYSWLASIFYFAYLSCEWPANYLAQCFPTGTFISICVICWGSILCCTAASHSFAGLGVCRFLLGAFEAPITPCFMLLVSTWYTRSEQPVRAGLFYCFNGVGSIVGGLLFYGVGQAKGWDVWRIIFVLCGGITICWGVVLFFFLPNTIVSARFYTVEQKALLVARSYGNQTGEQTRTIKTPQIWEALSDPQVWLLFFFVLLNECVNGGLANFGKLIVKGFTGGDALLTTVYGIPYGAWLAAFILSGSWLATRFANIRTYVMIAYVCPTLVAACLFWKLPRDGSQENGLLMAYYIAPSFVSSLVLALQLPAMNVGGYTKRVTSTSLVFLAYCAGNIIGPHAFLSSEAPVYQTGCKVIIACTCGQIVIALALRSLLVRRNIKRDEEARRAGPGAVGGVGTDGTILQDRTDLENREFRYCY